MVKMSISSLITFCMLIVYSSLPAQDSKTFNNTRSTIGLGIGSEYAGWGLQYEYKIKDRFLPFISMGLVPRHLGFNTGFKVSSNSYKGRFRLCGQVYYGINRYLNHSFGGIKFKKPLFGFSSGLGLDTRIKSGFFRISLSMAFLSQKGINAFIQEVNEVTPYYINPDLRPIFLSLGYSRFIK